MSGSEQSSSYQSNNNNPILVYGETKTPAPPLYPLPAGHGAPLLYRRAARGSSMGTDCVCCSCAELRAACRVLCMPTVSADPRSLGPICLPHGERSGFTVYQNSRATFPILTFVPPIGGATRVEKCDLLRLSAHSAVAGMRPRDVLWPADFLLPLPGGIAKRGGQCSQHLDFHRSHLHEQLRWAFG